MVQGRPPLGPGLRILLATLGGFLLFSLVEGILFRTELYSSFLEPESTTGHFEVILRNELVRQPREGKQVLGVGDSRMPLLPRIANQLRSKTGCTFSSIAVLGTTPRCWYYMLRDLDPDARRYAAIVVPLEDYDDEDRREDHAERIDDLHYVIARLRLSDVVEFSRSFTSVQSRWQVFRGGLFKGFIYKRDFQDFLLHPRARIDKVRWMRRDSAEWFYNFPGDPRTLRGLQVDYASGQIIFPEGLPQAMRDLVCQLLLAPAAPQTGREGRYRREWLGKIVDRYRASGTRVIFFRLPRSPVPRPGVTRLNQHSSVRELASRKNVVILDEHMCDSLERPEFFMDPLHMNREGITIFSKMLAEEVRKILGS